MSDITLSSFEGKEVIAASVEVHKLARSLGETTKVDPQEWPHDAKVYLLVEGTVKRVRHDEITDTDSLRRVHLVDADIVTVVDENFAKSELDEQRDRILRAKEEESGIRRLV